MSAFLRRVVYVMDDKSAEKSIRIRLLHFLFGNILSAVYVSVTGIFVITHVIRGRLNIAEATIDYLMLMGSTTCTSSVLFWRSSRPDLCVIFNHLAYAADMLEHLNDTTKKDVQRKMAIARKSVMLPFFGLWGFFFAIIAGALIGKYPIRIWLLDSTPHWFRLFFEVSFHSQSAVINVPGVCSILVVFLLSAGALFDCLNTEIRQCQGNEMHLDKMVLIHRELLIASVHARDLFANQLINFGSVWITVLLLSFFNMASGCFGVLAVAATPIALSIIIFNCETGDVLVTKSLETADAVCYSGWECSTRSFRQKASMILLRAQRPAYLTIRFAGKLNRPQLAILKKAYSIFTLMLTMFDETYCGAQ